ncbi:hypothetical protein MC885_011881 [Smutsia gigantea]|nr:hypothetical protein MC885_011881 [Smutsia gigantea]
MLQPQPYTQDQHDEVQTTITKLIVEIIISSPSSTGRARLWTWSREADGKGVVVFMKKEIQPAKPATSYMWTIIHKNAWTPSAASGMWQEQVSPSVCMATIHRASAIMQSKKL